MKNQIIELINKCITNKTFMVEPQTRNGNYYQAHSYSRRSHDTRWQTSLHISNEVNGITRTSEGRHHLQFHFEDAPSIYISSFIDEENKETIDVFITKNIIGMEYQKKYKVDVTNRKWKYLLTYGELEFDMQDFEVNDLVKDYKQNLADFIEAKYKEQVKQRIEKYS